MFFNKWLQNCACPGVWYGGLLNLFLMNWEHRRLLRFTRSFYCLPVRGCILDIGCGGGYNIYDMHKRSKTAIIFGLDMSPLSVSYTMRYNRWAIIKGRVRVFQGEVSSMPFSDSKFDLVTASETLYFWPDPARDFKEVYRVMTPGGTLMICLSSADPVADKKYSDIIYSMKIYTAEEISHFLTEAGVECINVNYSKYKELCVTANKPVAMVP